MPHHFYRKLLCSILGCFAVFVLEAQKGTEPATASPVLLHPPVSFTGGHAFIEQVGQYSADKQFTALGKVIAGFEGFSMPTMFTTNGILFLQKKITALSHHQEEELEKQGLPEEEIERRTNEIFSTVSLQWVDANPNPGIELLDKTTDYHTYGKMPGKAYGYRRILCKNMYPGIDILYSMQPQSPNGFEYSFIIHPGADIRSVKMKYGGDLGSLKLTGNGSLLVKTAIEEMTQSGLKAFSTNSEDALQPPSNTGLINARFVVRNKEVHIEVSDNYDHNKILVVDPFVSSSGALTGVSAGKAKDVDFDYAGNIYVTGGGDGNIHQLAKYDATGVLQWTFSGTLTNPAWTFGPYFGGWVVEKTTGNIYLGQGFNFNEGFIVVRISTTGLHDNYITNGNPNFRENWKMIWNCNNGAPQIIVAGGGTNSNINLGILTPPSVIPTATNLTGIASIAFQDMADMVIDPLTNSMYTIYASGSVPSLNNSIYKHNQPYSAATIAWNVPTAFNVLQEAANRPYMSGLGLNDNSANLLAINPTYLFYWDGRNLKAFDKTTGAAVGTALTIAGNTVKMQGGIIADACNNVFVGSVNGTIKVYSFNGLVFDDAAAPDIQVPGFATSAVYDLAYNETQKLLYASGDGFVSSIDVSSYCPNTVYTLNITPDCVTATATALLSPVPPAGSTVTYAIYNGTTLIATNTTGVFPSLSASTTYKIIATINQACSGTQSTAVFLMPGAAIGITQVNTTCGAASGSITAIGSGTTAPYTYSIDGINFLPGGTFNALSAGVYTITVNDGNGCRSNTQVTILNSNGPVAGFTQTNAQCGSNSGTVTATASGGAAPYQFSINNGSTYQNSNFFTGLLAGQYILEVKDALGCINASIINITSSPLPLVTAIPATATCGNANGIINAFATSGTAPYQYSIDGNKFQAGNTFANLTPGTYTVTVKDANGCSNTASAVIANTPAPTVTAAATQAACANQNGSITATGSGGVAPLQYCINNGPYQANNVFSALIAGSYTVSVQDVTGCIGVTSVNVVSISGGPTVTATSLPSSCSVNTGSISAVASGGVFPYQYSLNNTTYQASTLFSTLAAGNYVVFAKDAAGCVNTFSIAVLNTAGPSLTVTALASSCNVNDGVITATGTGGTGILQYSIDGVNFQVGNTFNGLAPNIYTVTVKDANGCSQKRTVTVANASGLSLSVSSISTSCNSNTGSVTATAAGGLPPLQYSIDGSNYVPGNTFSGLTVGTYTLYVKDANGCILNKSTTIVSISGPGLVLNSINATCGTASGAIEAFGSGGVAPLTYNIDGGAFQSVNAFVNLAAGNHTIVVKDASGCTASQSVNITNSAAASAPTDVTFVLKNALPCTGGVVKIKNLKGLPSGGGNHYTFSLDFGAFTGSNQFTGVPAGNHIITAMNDNGCTISKIAIIGTGIQATATYTAVSAPCNTTSGSITIAGVGLNTPYHASIDGGATWNTFFPPGANSFTFSGLAPGSYPIIMADDADFTPGTPDIPGACLTTIFAVVPSTGGPSLSTVQTPGTCQSVNGSITATGSAGTAPYLYNINAGVYAGTNVFSNLSPGVYSVTVKDATGCVAGANVTLTGPSVPVVTAAVLATSCNLSNAVITATVTGGVPPYQYSKDGFTFQPGNVLTNVAAGNYTLFAKDVNGCYGTVPVTVTATPMPQVTAFTIAASCGNNDGSIIASGTSGTAPYQYSLDGLLYQSSGTFSGLGAGFYTVTIKDFKGCTSTTGIVIGNIGAPGFSNTVTAASCGNSNGSISITATGGTAPYLYSSDGINFLAGSNLTGLVTGTYGVAVKDFNGCISTKIVLVGNTSGPQALTATVRNAFCGLNNGVITAAATGGVPPLQYSRDGVTFQVSNIFNAVPAGNYTLYVRDANTCMKTLPVTVTDLSGPSVMAALPSPATCVLSDGTITAAASGGTGLLAYSIDGVNFQGSNIFTALSAGIYSVTVKDNKGCAASLNNVEITALSGLSMSTAQTAPSCGNNDGSIDVTAGAGNGPYEYSLDGVNFQPGNTFNVLFAGLYTVTVKDANGCSTAAPVTLVTLPVAGVKTWLGVNTNWHDPVNWCGGVPVITDDVLIPSGLTSYPEITTGVGYMKNISIQTGASLLVTAAVQIADTISNQGIFNAVQGTVELNGASQQNIAGSFFVGHTIHQLIISNTSAAGVVVSSLPADTLKISGKLAFGYDHAVFTTGDQVTLLSSDTATAAIGVIPENVDGTPMVTINGNMIVERYYPEKRAWRLITAPIKADAAAPSVNAAWQENANPPSVTNVANPDPHPSYGTHITGPFLGAAAYSPLVTASGFDQSPQNNSSMKYFTGATNSYNAVTNTFTTKVTDRQGFLMFVRGDRSYDISTTSNTMAPAPTILRERGNVNTGMIQVPADTGLQVVGNPYPSAIRFGDAMFADNAAILKNQSFWLWDPLRGSARNSPSNVGGWIPVVYAGGGVYISTYNPSQSVAGLDSAHAFDIDGSIQSGAAFMIDNKATATGNFIIHENSKIDGSNNQLFRPTGNTASYLHTSLFRADATGKPLYWADATMQLFDGNYTNEAEPGEDVRKINGGGENICIRINDTRIAVEKRRMPQPGDTVWYDVNKLKAGRYRFEIYGSNMPAPPAEVFFEDAYTGLQTPISFTSHNLVDVEVNADAASFAANRFRLIYKSLAALPVTLADFTAWQQDKRIPLQWTVDQQQSMAKYVVEESADGNNFTVLATVAADLTATGQITYHAVDEDPIAGNNFYRIRMVEQDGSVHYSPTVLVSIVAGISYIQVSPNPVHNGNIQLLMQQVEKSKYRYELYDAAGKLLAKGSLLHEGGNRGYEIQADKKPAPGIYRLVLVNAKKQRLVLNVAIAD